MSLVNIANDWVFRKSWSRVLNFEIDKWVTDEALALLEYQIPKNAFGKKCQERCLKEWYRGISKTFVRGRGERTRIYRHHAKSAKVKIQRIKGIETWV